MELKLAIVDDEQLQRNILEEFVSRYGAEKRIVFDVRQYASGESLLEEYRPGVDILLLDVQMQGIDGMETARRIREMDESVLILFITNMAQYAIQGYSVDALHFMVKPVEYPSFRLKMDKAIDRIEKSRPQHLQLKADQGLLRLRHEELYYAEMSNRKLYLHTAQGIYSNNSTLNNLEASLASRGFFRCHVGFLVNLRHVQKVEKATALVAGERIPISRHRKKTLLDALTNYLGDNL